MTGRAVILATLILALIAGAALYYLQVYAYYTEVAAEEAGGVRMTLAATGVAEDIPFADFRGIDSNSSPIRFRACFTTPLAEADLAARFVPYPDPTPLIAPGWFDCFDAEAIGAALESGEARAYLGVGDIRWGIDRVVAILPDGRGFAWHQINPCGAVVFNGEPAPAGCPPQPEGAE
jgi:hypothetical protein